MVEMNRVVIKFCFKAGLCVCDRNANIGAKGLWEWGSERIEHFSRYSLFRDGREKAEDYERGGHPKSTRTEVNIPAVADLVKSDRRIASRMIAESLNIPKTVVLRILKEDLRKRKLSARFVPHCLTPGQREDRVISCQDIARADADRNFFNDIITGDEAWCFAYDSKTKRQSSEMNW
jgi:histone-lysine N-methyltransferase SETMAR